MIFQDIDAYRASGFTPRIIVIGAGPAGITVTRRLAAARIPCVLLDAGGDSYSDESQSFYEGQTIGDYYFDLSTCRLRYLGGTSGHWTGWCRMLDRSDFEKRAWIPNSGWPIGREEIEPYFASTREILELRDFKNDKAISQDFNWIDLIRSDPVRFGDKYYDELDKSEHVAVVLNTYATDLTARDGRITSANLYSNGRDGAAIAADRFVVACGGIENSRLLLWSNARSPEPVVPDDRALGRYWMEHPEFVGGESIVRDYAALDSDAEGWAFFAPTPEAMERAEVANFHALVIPNEREGTKKLVADLACTAPSAAEWLVRSVGSHLTCGARISVAWEQVPDLENRVALSQTATDDAGVPLVELHWRKNELDRRTILEGMKMFGQTFAQDDFGRVKVREWLLEGEDYPIDDEEIAGYHHMGGTRMSADPSTGIVDSNCRVHGMPNLYVAGSSIFATSGYANPTATIIAFAERLGSHLAAEKHAGLGQAG